MHITRHRNTFYGCKKALKNALAIESPDNKFEDITLKDGSKDITYHPGTLMIYALIYGKT